MDQFLDKINPFYLDKFKAFYEKLQELRRSSDFYSIAKKGTANKDILFITATHGDEGIGVDAVKSILSQGESEQFDWIIANERGFEQNKRFIDCDMNRNAPGKIDSDKYEERRVVEVLEKAKNYNYVIDLHGAHYNCGVFIIITKFSFDDLLLAMQFDIPNIVIWPGPGSISTGPLTEFINPGIEIESGPKDDESIREQLIGYLNDFLKNYNKPFSAKKLTDKNIFIVYGKLDNCTQELRDFEKTDYNGEIFYPLLVGEYGISCYKMFKVEL